MGDQISDLEREFFERSGRSKEFEVYQAVKPGSHAIPASEDRSVYEGGKIAYSIETSDMELMAAAQVGFVYAAELLKKKKKIRESILVRARSGIRTSREILEKMGVSIPDYIADLKYGVNNKIAQYKKIIENTSSEEEKASYQNQIDKIKSYINDPY